MREMLSTSKTIAVVGISDKPDRSSYTVSDFMRAHYSIIPINPNLESVFGIRCYKTLTEVPPSIKIDIVNIFRRSDQVVPIVQEALSRNVRYIWMQQGVINDEAKSLAEKAGVKVVMDACIAVAYSTLMRPK